MLRHVRALLREKRYSAGYGGRLGGVRGTPTCQQPSGPRPRGGKGGDKSSSQSDFKGGLCITLGIYTLFGPTKDRGGFHALPPLNNCIIQGSFLRNVCSKSFICMSFPLSTTASLQAHFKDCLQPFLHFHGLSLPKVTTLQARFKGMSAAIPLSSCPFPFIKSL